MVLFLGMSLSCSSPTKSHPTQAPVSFLDRLASQPDQIWAPGVDPKVKNATSDFLARKKLPNGKIYGDSIRTFSLEGQCLKDLDQKLRQMECERKDDVIKEPQSKKPILTAEGKRVPLWVYLCSDGGVVRIKPEGDSTNKRRPQPHSSKALRYPFNSKFETFDDEIVKIDNSGNPIPKWPKDLDTTFLSTQDKTPYLDSWANDAHTDLRQDCP
jgi:hypothetical protein